MGSFMFDDKSRKYVEKHTEYATDGFAIARKLFVKWIQAVGLLNHNNVKWAVWHDFFNFFSRLESESHGNRWDQARI